MKKLYLFLFILLLTGCDITYNLDVDNSLYKENFQVKEENTNNYSYTLGGVDLVSYNDYYVNDFIPLHYNDLYSPEGHSKFDGVSYYDIKDLSNDNQIGLSMYSNFKSLESYSKSNLLWKGCQNKSVLESDGIISIKASGFKTFDEFDILDKVTINIKSNFKAISNNADSVSGDVYTWVITRDNYNDKSIEITFKTSNIVDDAVKEVKTNSMVKFGIVIWVVIVIGLLVYFFVKRKYNKRNSL